MCLCAPCQKDELPWPSGPREGTLLKVIQPDWRDDLITPLRYLPVRSTGWREVNTLLDPVWELCLHPAFPTRYQEPVTISAWKWTVILCGLLPQAQPLGLPELQTYTYLKAQ